MGTANDEGSVYAVAVTGTVDAEGAIALPMKSN
jgi:hypothetical protein